MYMYNLPPPLIITPPNKKNIPLGLFCLLTINLDGGTITPLVRNDFWFDLPPSCLTPPNNKNLGGKHICYYQFRRRHDDPPYKKTMCGQTPPEY